MRNESYCLACRNYTKNTNPKINKVKMVDQ